MKKKSFIVVGIVLLGIIGVIAGIKALQIRALMASGSSFSMPPETISGAEVQEQTWEGLIPAVGSVTAVQGVLLRAELAGTVREIAFTSGGTATAGKVLVQLDVTSELAQLRASEAQAELARMNLARAKDLAAQGVTSQSDLDSREAAFRQSTGDVEIAKAAIAKKTIRAPFTGQLGIREVNLGQYVNAGDPIVSLQSLDPVYVEFNLPEQQLSKVAKGTAIRVGTDGAPGRTFQGTITAHNPEIDPATRNVKVQATVPNPDGALRPGMFAKVQLVLPEVASVLVVPATAVLHAPYGDSVFVITETKDEKTGASVKTAKMTTVRLGDTRGDWVVVTAGVQKGQTVATSGVFKLRNGSSVVIDNSLAPDAQAAPKPAES
jgi:membrane fusion protein (multidrug efflux system)